MRRRWAGFGLFLVVLMTVPVLVWAEQALQSVETRVRRIIEVLNDPALQGKSHKAVKEKKIQAFVDEIFDYTELSKRALAFHWESFTPEQRKEFIHLFGRLLRNVYMGRILAHTNEKVVFGKETRLSENTTEVESEIETSTQPISIRYRLILQKDQWKIYDVVIEGVSLVQNYRSQFRAILSKETPEGLLKILRKRTANS